MAYKKVAVRKSRHTKTGLPQSSSGAKAGFVTTPQGVRCINCSKHFKGKISRTFLMKHARTHSK